MGIQSVGPDYSWSEAKHWNTESQDIWDVSSALALLFCSDDLFPLYRVPDVDTGSPALVRYRATYVSVPWGSVLWIGGGLLNSAVHKSVQTRWVYLLLCASKQSLPVPGLLECQVKSWRWLFRRSNHVLTGEFRASARLELTLLQITCVRRGKFSQSCGLSGFLFCFCNGRKVLNPCLQTLHLFMTTKGWESIVVETRI